MSMHLLDDFDAEHRTHRLFYEFETHIRDVNRRHIEAAAGTIRREALLRLADVVARQRARYVKRVLELASGAGGEEPGEEIFAAVREARLAYEEALQGFGALRHALERGYFQMAE